MPESLTLTFAEIEFVLAARPQQAEQVRRDLRLEPEQDTATVVRAGLASLMARGLCESADTSTDGIPDLRLGAHLATVATVLSAADTHVTAAAWCGDRSDLMHVYGGGGFRLALFPFRYGRFSVEILDPAEPLSAPLTRFLDVHLAEAAPSVFIAKSGSDQDPNDLAAFAVAIDAAGAWSLSDTRHNPDRALPSTRDEALPRLAELFDAV